MCTINPNIITKYIQHKLLEILFFLLLLKRQKNQLEAAHQILQRVQLRLQQGWLLSS